MGEHDNRINFTVKALESVTCPASGRPQRDGRTLMYDTKVPGLVFRVTEGGARAFYLYRRIPGRPSPARIKLGDEHAMSIDQARRKAATLNSEIARGVDPVAERLAAKAAAAAPPLTVPTLADLWEAYRGGHLASRRPKTITEFTRLYDAHLKALEARPVAGITTADLATVRARIGATRPIVANRVMELASAMFRRCGHHFGLPRKWTPTVDLDRYPEKPRDRVISPEELAKVLAAIKAEPYETARDYFLMLIYTGARRSNVAAMRWDDISLQRCTWKIPGQIAKNGQPLIVNLVPEAVELLKTRPDASPFVFPARRLTQHQVEEARAQRAAGHSTHDIAREMGVSQTAVCAMLSPNFKPPAEASFFTGAGYAWRRILERAGITQRTTIHDIRRSVCTAMIENGTPLPVVSAIMGHRSMATTERHYAHARQSTVAAAMTAGVAAMLAEAVKAAENQDAQSKTG
jgi:integrase